MHPPPVIQTNNKVVMNVCHHTPLTPSLSTGGPSCWRLIKP
jgi:hypothetical protein